MPKSLDIIFWRKDLGQMHHYYPSTQHKLWLSITEQHRMREDGWMDRWMNESHPRRKKNQKAEFLGRGVEGGAKGKTKRDREGKREGVGQGK